MPDSNQPQPVGQTFDERSALEELELLADKIQISRRQREQKVAEFDAFVRGFRHDRLTASIAATERESRRAEDRQTPASRATQSARGVLPTDADVEPVSGPGRASSSLSESEAWNVVVPRESAAETASATPRRPWAAYFGVALAAAAVIVVAVLVWRSSAAPDAPATPVNPQVDSVASPAPAAPAAAPGPAITPPPAAAAGPPRALNIELVTVRPVWARVTVDGRRAMEREFTANQRFMFGADREIAIRAGDAGAFRLIVDGRDLGVLGRDGQVFDRVFTPR